MRQRPQEQDKILRRSNFDAVEENLTAEQVKLEANRCLNCKNPQCVKGCPVNIQIPDFIKALKEDDLDRFLLRLDALITRDGLDERDNMTAFGHETQAVYDEVYMCNE